MYPEDNRLMAGKAGCFKSPERRTSCRPSNSVIVLNGFRLLKVIYGHFQPHWHPPLRPNVYNTCLDSRRTRVRILGRIPMLSAFGKRLLRHKQRLHRWVEHKKWCWIESAYAKHMCLQCLLYFFRISIPSNWESSDVTLVRISEKVKQSENFVYAITKYVSLPLTLSSLTITVTLTPRYTVLHKWRQLSPAVCKKLDFRL